MGSVRTQTRTQSAGPEPLLTLDITASTSLPVPWTVSSTHWAYSQSESLRMGSYNGRSQNECHRVHHNLEETMLSVFPAKWTTGATGQNSLIPKIILLPKGQLFPVLTFYNLLADSNTVLCAMGVSSQILRTPTARLRVRRE